MNPAHEKYWDVKAPGFDWHTVQAATRAKAIYDQWSKARDAGYNIPWIAFRARRSQYV